jgi:hypothetical protein
MHWHGSVPNESFTMTFVTMGAGATTTGEPITDDIYLGEHQTRTMNLITISAGRRELAPATLASTRSWTAS